MRKIIFSAAASAILALSATAADGKIDRESFLATGQIYLAAQLLSKGTFDIELDVSRYGHTSTFDKMIGREPSDENWREGLSIQYDAMICSTQEGIGLIKEKGVDIKSYVGDVSVVAMREAVKVFKDDGAKYIFVEIVNKDKSVTGEPITNMPFDKSFTYMITNSYDSKNASKWGWITGVPSAENKGRIPPPAFLQIQQAPYKRCSGGSDWSGLASAIAQMGFMALGAKGASTGNISLTTFSSNAANVASSGGKSTNQETTSQNTQGGENFAAQAVLKVSAIKSLDYFKDPARQRPGMQAFVFPIEDVEKTLERYMDLPYSSRITYEGK